MNFCERCDQPYTSKSTSRSRRALSRYCSLACSPGGGGRKVSRPFDVRPLLARVSTRDLAAAAGVLPNTVQVWTTRGITEQRADELACAFGYHPSEIWECWYWLDDIRDSRELRRERIEKRFRRIGNLRKAA